MNEPGKSGDPTVDLGGKTATTQAEEGTDVRTAVPMGDEERPGGEAAGGEAPMSGETPGNDSGSGDRRLHGEQHSGS
jgi:hypothetical protein